MVHFVVRVALGIVIGLACVPSASADTRLWNVTSGNFSDPASWSGGVPVLGDIAWFDHNFGGGTPPYMVTFRGLPVLQGPLNLVSSQLQIGANTVNFLPSLDLSRGPATYTLDSAILVGDNSNLGVLNTSIVSLGSPLVRISAFSNGQGTLYVNAGTFNVTGAGSAGYELRVGEFGAGFMSVNSGAQAIISGAESNAVLGQHVGASGVMNVIGPNAVWSNASNSPTAPLVIGDEGTGAMNISGGAQVDDYDADIAVSSTSGGSVSVAGNGSTWTNRGDLRVSVLGPASLSISGGGQVSSMDASVGAGDGGNGAAVVSGGGSKWVQSLELHLGADLGTIVGGGDIMARGTLDILNGGQTETHGDAFIRAPGSAAKVDGIGSVWSVGGQLEIDHLAVLRILSGGLVRSGSALVSSYDDGTVHVSGAGSAWEVADVLQMGRSGNATVNVTEGGHVSNRLGMIGVGGAIFAPSSALVVVDGAGSTWTSSEQLFVGYLASGQFVVTNGGQAFSGTGQIGLNTASTGYVSVNGADSRWTNSESLYVGVAGTGNLVVSNGGTVVVDDLLSIGLRGTVEGNSHIDADVRNGGVVAPGVSTSFVATDALGTLHVDGNYTQIAAGALQIQLASAANYDKLAIVGHATLAGTLRPSLFGGFVPAVGSAFQILTATNGISGTFNLDATSLSPAPGGSSWVVIYSGADVLLKLANFLAGDYNHNGVVDAADYTVWRNSLGQTAVGLAADGNGDHTITQADYDVWKMHFGQTAGSGADAGMQNVVPEPASWLLFIGVCCGLARSRSPKR